MSLSKGALISRFGRSATNISSLRDFSHPFVKNSGFRTPRSGRVKRHKQANAMSRSVGPRHDRRQTRERPFTAPCGHHARAY